MPMSNISYFVNTQVSPLPQTKATSLLENTQNPTMSSSTLTRNNNIDKINKNINSNIHTSRKSVSHSSKLQNNTRHPDSLSYSGPDLKIFVKDVSDPNSRKRPITLKTWSTIKDVKDVVQKLLNIPPSLQRLYSGPFMTSGVCLPNHRSLHDAGIYKNGQVLYLEIKGLPSTATSLSSSSSLFSYKNRKKIFDLSTLKHVENDICISKAMFDTTPKLFKSIIKQCRIGLACNIKPELVLDGSGGTYFLHDRNKRKTAVFKPADEEPYAVNNPRGYVKSGQIAGSMGHSDAEDDLSMRAGIKPGEACLREVAAYLLDEEKGISGVPMTTLVEARHTAFHSNGSMLNLNQGGAAVGSHSFIPSASMTGNMIMPSASFQSLSSLAPRSDLSATPKQSSTNESSLASPASNDRNKKVGSCQEFVPSECSMDDISPSKLSVEEVQKIAILDIRILNADRNTANLLCRRNPENPEHFELIPIDHGYCLRTVADVCWFDWCWLDWPQLKEPLSPRLREFVLSLDIEKDAKMLKDKLDIPDRALDFFRASSKLLQRGVKAGMNLYEIAILCCRNDDSGERPSKLENILSMAAEIANSAVDNGRWHHTAASRALEQQLSPENTSIMSKASYHHTMSTTRNFKNSESIFKSISSTNFCSLVNYPSTAETVDSDDLSSNPYPSKRTDDKVLEPMAQSSGSESSTDSAAEDEREECEKWAADFIADTLFSPLPPPMANSPHRQRSISFAGSVSSDSSDDSSQSDDSSELSRSPVGFWFVPPSASKPRPPSDDDDTVWSPQVSPSTSAQNIQLPRNRDRKVTFDTSGIPLADLSMDSISNTSGEVTNSLSTTTNQSRHSHNHEMILGNEHHRDENLPNLIQPYGMKRSLSYSAFSFKRISDNNSTESKAGNPNSIVIGSNEYGKYFEKFINLLIDRETTPLAKN